jgi:hypothetical protein
MATYLYMEPLGHPSAAMPTMSETDAHAARIKKPRDSASPIYLTPKSSRQVASLSADMARPSDSEVDSLDARPWTPP